MKKRISVILPKNAIQEIRQNMLDDGYSLREKSKWIVEAIEDFLALKDYQVLVEMAELIEGLSRTEVVSITEELSDKLDYAIVEVRKRFPAVEGVKSLIVRASIIRRLIIRGKRQIK